VLGLDYLWGTCYMWQGVETGHGTWYQEPLKSYAFLLWFICPQHWVPLTSPSEYCKYIFSFSKYTVREIMKEQGAMCSEIRAGGKHVTKVWKQVTVLGTKNPEILTPFCFGLFVPNNILWLAPLSCHNACGMFLITLGDFINYWGAILLGLGPYFSLSDAFLLWSGNNICSFQRSCLFLAVLVMQFIGLLCPGKCWHWHILQNCLLTLLACPPIGQPVPSLIQKDVQCLLHEETVSFCSSFRPWHCLGLSLQCLFHFLWFVFTLCLSITNVKTCNGEAVPSSRRNCFSFVDLLGLGPAGGYAIGLFSLFMVCATLCLAFHWLSPYTIFITPMPQGIYMPIFCSSTDSFATFCFSLFLVCFHALACLLFYFSFACCSFACQPLILVHRLR